MLISNDGRMFMSSAHAERHLAVEPFIVIRRWFLYDTSAPGIGRLFSRYRLQVVSDWTLSTRPDPAPAGPPAVVRLMHHSLDWDFLADPSARTGSLFSDIVPKTRPRRDEARPDVLTTYRHETAAIDADMPAEAEDLVHFLSSPEPLAGRAATLRVLVTDEAKRSGIIRQMLTALEGRSKIWDGLITVENETQMDDTGRTIYRPSRQTEAGHAQAAADAGMPVMVTQTQIEEHRALLHAREARIMAALKHRFTCTALWPISFALTNEAALSTLCSVLAGGSVDARAQASVARSFLASQLDAAQREALRLLVSWPDVPPQAPAAAPSEG